MTHGMTSGAHFDLARFVLAQESTYQRAADELRSGRKRGHWIWFIFPQLKGLGSSANSEFYGLATLDEARAYLAHAVLGVRLIEVTNLVCRHKDRNLRDILGAPDDLKFRSSMTLFAEAAGPESVFEEALLIFCGGAPDPATLAMLRVT